MDHISDKLFILHILCTLQLQPLLLMMASTPSTSTATSTTAKQDPMPPPRNTTPGKKKSRCKTHLIYTQSCPYICCPEICEVAKLEQQTGKSSPEIQKMSPSPSRKLPLFVTYSNYCNG